MIRMYLYYIGLNLTTMPQVTQLASCAITVRHTCGTLSLTIVTSLNNLQVG